jgi:hypothetical protein
VERFVSFCFFKIDNSIFPTMVAGVLHADMGHQGSSGGSSSPALVTLPLSCATLHT